MNGPATLVGEFTTQEGGDQTIQGLAFGNGTLYGSDTAGNAVNSTPEGIYTIDSSGVTTLVLDLTVNDEEGIYDIGGIAFNPVDGLLYGTNDVAFTTDLMRGLVAIDIAAQTVTLVAEYPNNETDIDGLAISDDGIAYLIDDDNSNPSGGGGLFYSYDLSQGANGSFNW